MNQKKIIASLMYLTLQSFHVIASYNNDLQSWNSLVITKQDHRNLIYSLETQLRFGDNISTFSQGIIRPSLSLKIDSNQSATLGYAWINTRLPFSMRTFDEHRIWQQYLFSTEHYLGKITSRTRLEQRFIERISKTGWRLREQVKIQKPMISQKYFFVVMDEFFLQVNNTSATSNNQGFEQNRLMLGAGFYLNHQATLEFGLQNQIIRRVAAQDFVGNALVMNINYPIN